MISFAVGVYEHAAQGRHVPPQGGSGRLVLLEVGVVGTDGTSDGDERQHEEKSPHACRFLRPADPNAASDFNQLGAGSPVT
jgi:hypothetical protein